MIEEFKLKDNKWLKDMYEIREDWIPSYFRCIPMHGLMRTTSLFESENSFFRNCKNVKSTLLEFMMRYEGVMDKQRRSQCDLDFVDDNTTVKFATNLKIERHAYTFYTRTVSSLVQE